MKIGVVRQRYVPIGGAERYLDGVIRELVARGHDVHVFANSWQGASEGFQFHRVPMARGTSFLKVLTFALNCRRMVEREKFDVLFSLERTLKQDVYRAGDGVHREWLRQRSQFTSGLKNLSIRMNPLHNTLLWLERQTFSPECTGRIIANSHRGKREIVEHYGYPAERIDVIHNGVDCNRFRPPKAKAPSDGVMMLFVGTGFERKGLGFCIRVLALLPTHVHLQVIGKGSISQYEALARSMGVLERVHFSGQNSDMPAAYQRADLLIHPAIYEPFANVCLEALASGLPVITSAANGASEVIEPGKSGAIVEHPEDTEALAAAIRPFLDPNFRGEAAKRARAVAEAHAFEAHVTETLRILTM
jgi:UDP-glucose:(heptosyl)LPS alpha-1,3-glucosyltransferase